MNVPFFNKGLAADVKEKKAVDKELGGRIADSVAAFGVICLSGYFWYLGAYLTLLFLEGLGVPVKQIGIFAWSIPGLISFIELRFFPDWKQLWSGRTVATFIAAIPDIGSTYFGALKYLSTLNSVEWGAGLTLPKEGRELTLGCVVISLVLTFGPEAGVIWSIKEIMKVWEIKQFWIFTAEVA